MKIKNVIIVLVFLFLVNISLFAQTPEEILKTNIINLSLPDNNINDFSMDLIIETDSGRYLSQVRYNKSKIAFNCFDKDKTPLLVARDSNVLINDILKSNVGLLRNNIFIVNAVLENDQLNANINFHQPNDEENTNKVKIDFLKIAEQAKNDLKITEEDGLITITGMSSKGSMVNSIINPKDAFPLKKMIISNEGFCIFMENISANAGLDESVFYYPKKELSKTGIKLEDLTTDNVLNGLHMLNKIMVSAMVRAVLDDEKAQKEIEPMISSQQPVDWPKLKASDVLKSAKLRTIFKPF